MSRYSDLAKGAKARTTIDYPSGDGEASVKVDLRVLSASEEADAIARARTRAKAKGVNDPKLGDSIYDLALMAETVFAATHEASKPELFFDSADQVWDLDRDRIQFLYQAHAGWLDRCSPRMRSLSPEDFVAGIAILASEDADESTRFFEQCGPGLQWIYVRTLARRLLDSQTPKSGSGSTTVASGNA